MRKHFRFFLLVGLAALVLRLIFVFAFPAITSDSDIYANIASNWLHHSSYALTEGGQIVPTDIRLPGYPALLALIFFIARGNHFVPVLLAQVLFDLGTCFLIADLARRLFSHRAAMAAFLLSGLCPFLANYSAAALAETAEIFFTVVALDFAVIGLQDLGLQEPGLQELDSQKLRSPESQPKQPSRMRLLQIWPSCGLAVGVAILFRPDGGLLLVSLGICFAWIFLRAIRSHHGVGSIVPAAVLTGIFALLPLLPWTLRNFHTLHEFQALAPRYATDPGEYLAAGFNLWTKTWIADYASVEEVYWNVPGYSIDIKDLPSRAFDSSAQRAKTEQMLNAYNQTKSVSPELDAQFFDLARERIHTHPFRYYMGLPASRIADMWLRPRTGLLPADVRWWEWNDSALWSAVTLALGAINLVYIVGGLCGFFRVRPTAPLVLLALFCAVRSLFLGTLENPEPRYTLEMYPVVIIFFSACFAGRVLSKYGTGTGVEGRSHLAVKI